MIRKATVSDIKGNASRDLVPMVVPVAPPERSSVVLWAPSMRYGRYRND
jgi:hypothetical protein